METLSPNRSVGMTVVAALALVQGVTGGLRALHWFDTGSDLLGQGLLLLPLMGLLAFFRGSLVAAIALLYVVFACGAFLGRSWARWHGIGVAAVTLLLVASVVVQGEALGRALLWSLVPVVMLYYLLTPAGRQALTRGN